MYYLVSDEFAREFQEIKTLIRSIRGPGVANTPLGITIKSPAAQRKQAPPSPAQAGIFPVALVASRLPEILTGSPPSDITYTAYKFRTVALATTDPSGGGIIGAAGLIPLKNLFGNVAHIIQTATVGYGCYDSDGTFVLLECCNEIYRAGACTN